MPTYRVVFSLPNMPPRTIKASGFNDFLGWVIFFRQEPPIAPAVPGPQVEIGRFKSDLIGSITFEEDPPPSAGTPLPLQSSVGLADPLPLGAFSHSDNMDEPPDDRCPIEGCDYPIGHDSDHGRQPFKAG